MKNYSFKNWAEARTISEAVDSEPKPGDFVITNPKAFMDSVIGRRGGLKNDGIANLRNFSRFKVNNVDGRKVTGDVHHRTYSGGHSKKFNSYDFLDVSPAFGLNNGSKVWLNNAPGRRATAHYINKMYPIWAGKMGIEGFATPEQQMQANQAAVDRQMQQQMQQATQPQQQMQQMQQPQRPQPQPQQQMQQPQPQMQQRPQQAAPWQKPQQPQGNYTMQNREVTPRSDHGDTASGRSGGTGYGFEKPADNYSQSGVIPMGGGSVGGSDANFGTPDQGMGGGEEFSLAASYDPSIMNYSNVWKNPGDTKRYEYYPE